MFKVQCLWCIIGESPGQHWTHYTAMQFPTNIIMTMEVSPNYFLHFYCLVYKWRCFRPQFCTVRPYWAGENLSQWDEFCYESCPWYRIRPARYHCATVAPYLGYNNAYRVYRMIARQGMRLADLKYYYEHRNYRVSDIKKKQKKTTLQWMAFYFNISMFTVIETETSSTHFQFM